MWQHNPSIRKTEIKIISLLEKRNSNHLPFSEAKRGVGIKLFGSDCQRTRSYY
jgi:hypothetical protein